MKDKALRKGQTFTPDFFFSAVIFIFIVNIAFLAWNSAQDKTIDFESDNMQRKIFYITDMLARTQGFPHDWNSTYIDIPGLADSPNIINISRMNELENISYDNLTYMWGIAYYDFNLTIKSDNIYKTAGKEIDMESDYITPIERVVLIQDDDTGTLEKGLLRFTLWKR